MSSIIHTKFENNPQWDSIRIEGRWSTWDVSSCSNGDVEIEFESTAVSWSEHLFLNQDELKEFIQFLQTKLK